MLAKGFTGQRREIWKRQDERRQPYKLRRARIQHLRENYRAMRQAARRAGSFKLDLRPQA